MYKNEINSGLEAIGIAVLLGILFSPILAAIIFVGIAIYFAGSGIRELNSIRGWNQSVQETHIPETTSAPITDEPTIAEQIKSIHMKNDFKCSFCGATVLPMDVKCKHCGSVLVATANLPRPAKWGDVEIGQSIQVKHPKKGSLDLRVIHRLYYGELWQTQMKTNVPWTLTGSYYVGLGLTENIFLMNWQSQFYLLESHQPLTDMSINRDFAPHARKFAASNQTRNISFSYQEKIWEMFDIGRFRIEFADGDGTQIGPGAVGRFIHARQDNRILVVEDYQSGGSGLDMLWMGYQIEEESIKM